MSEFLAITASFAFGLAFTAALAFGLEHRQLANNPVDQDANVRPGIVAVSASGYAMKLPSEMPLQLGYRAGSTPNDM